MTDDSDLTGQPKGANGARPDGARNPVARLAEALAAAQEVARSASETDETAPTPKPTPTPRSEPQTDPVSLHDRIAALDVLSDGEPLRDVQPVSDAQPISGPAPRVGGAKAIRRKSFWPIYAVMAVLILAVPALIAFGYSHTSQSTAGDLLSGRGNPQDPGYTALVSPTPVALVVIDGGAKAAESISVLSLSGDNHRGGAVLNVPSAARLSDPHKGLTTFADALGSLHFDAAATTIGTNLGLGFSESVQVTSADLVRYLKPVSPLTIDNPTDVTTPDGTFLAAGTHQFSADEIPGYLGAHDSSGSTDNQMQRQGLFFKAWIAAIAKAKGTAFPGETTSGLGYYLLSLAKGSTTVADLPSSPGDESNGMPTVKIDRMLTNLMVANAVPFPVGAAAGDRISVSLLNGTGPTEAPLAVVQRLTFAGAQIVNVGNASHFSIKRTSLTYSDPTQARQVLILAKWLGVGNVKLDQLHPGTADVTIVMGSDLLNNSPNALTVDDIN